MADALVSIALEKLIDVIEDVGRQLSLFAGATSELQKLYSTFQSIQAVLADAESKQVNDNNVKLWLSRLRHVAYDIDDLAEDWRISGLRNEEGNEDDGNRRKRARLLFDCAYNLWDYAVYRCKVASDIKEIRERLDEIADEKNRFGFSNSTQGGDQRELVWNQRQTTSLMNKSEMIIGREHDKELMISRLVSGSSHEDGGQAHVVAIFGIGGLGKTTLAREIYNDVRVHGHFNGDLYWVCVSEVFDEIRLTKAILEQVKKGSTSLLELDTLQKELLEALRGKRFLLVLDDVWNDDAEKWEMLRLSLESGAHGSRILVTTRSQKVANTMNAAFIHELKDLSDDNSWELFKSRAFAGRKAEEILEFENVGKKIVNKCKGVPLSIKVIGSAMNSKRTVDDWEKILESATWSLPQVADKILPPLLLTYCNLPTRLKPCFVYCSMFPKDRLLRKDTLIRLWVAQGYIQSEGNREIEDIGEEYFDDLVAWSMFQEVRNYYGKTRYTMHDLLHDLAEFIAKDEVFCSEGGNSEETSSRSSNVRHAFISFADCDDMPTKVPITAHRTKKLRTLWLDGTVDGGINSVIDDLFHQARFLRALYFPSSTALPKSIGKLKHLTYLHLPYSKIAKLPNAIGKLKQLRYLDLFHNSNIVEWPESVTNLRNLRRLHLSQCGKLKKLPRGIGGMVSLRYLDLSHNSNLVELPESVSHLRNLHRLNLTKCGKLEKLPRGIGGMVSLRHLEIEGTDKLKYLPKGLGRISGLRSLCKFIVGGGDEGEGCGIDELQPLNSLHGSLYIQHLEKVSSREESEKAELWKKQYLCSLALGMPYGRNGDAETGMIDSVLEGLRPHENLEKLEITGFTGSKLPSWMDEMRCLRKLVLYSSLILERVPQLLSLKKLHFQLVRNETLPDEGWERLVALQVLIIWNCMKLKCLPEGLTQLPSLENLHIYGCYKLESLPEGLGQLKKLNSLKVSALEVLTCLPNSLGQLESLESLDISYCKKLESFPVSLGQLKKLKSLTIGRLEVLRYLPDSIGQLKSLEHLVIYYLKKLVFLPISLGQLESLESLDISSCEKLEPLPISLGQLKKLKSLTIDSLEVLRCLPDWVGQLESLESLDIRSCKKLESLPVSLGQLKKLKSLVVGRSEGLRCLPDSVGSEVLRCLPDSVGQLKSLESLDICYCRKLESLPVSLGQLKKLKWLYVGGSEVLTCLPDSIAQLESLERLKIYDLKKLKSLPQGLRHLSLLRELIIVCCPLVTERCKREGGVDWLNISHIPYIYINHERIQ